MKYIKMYTLSDPETHEIRYVGMTSKSLKERLKNHWSHIYQNNHRVNWIKSLREKGIKPIIELIEEVPVEEWQFWEQYWVNQFKIWNFRLVNSTLGGEGTFGYKHPNPYWKGRKRSAEQIANLSIRMKKAVENGDFLNPNPKGNKRDISITNKSAEGHKKPIIQYNKQGEKLQEFSSLQEAVEKLNIIKTAISNNLNGRSKTCHNYVFKYKN